MSSQIAHRSTTPQKLQTQLDFILLDSSGSMEPTWWDSVTAVQLYVEELQKNKVNSHIMLTTFDTTDKELLHFNDNISQWQDLLTAKEPIAGYFTSTPLWDAIMLAGAKLRDLDPPRCAFTIVTDGGEAGSSFATEEQAKAIIAWMRAKGWQVTFIGADFDNSTLAARLGLHPNAAIGVDRKMLKDATKALGEKRAKYGLYGTDMHWTDDERQDFGGFLSGPSAK